MAPGQRLPGGALGYRNTDHQCLMLDKRRRRAGLRHGRFASAVVACPSPDWELERRQLEDLAQATTIESSASEGLAVPQIPNMAHWFDGPCHRDCRANVRTILRAFGSRRSHQRVFLLCFASIIRSASNADPVPVSGLEVTAHMRSGGMPLDASSIRLLSFRTAVIRGLDAMEQFAVHPRRTLRLKCSAPTTNTVSARSPYRRCCHYVSPLQCCSGEYAATNSRCIGSG